MSKATKYNINKETSNDKESFIVDANLSWKSLKEQFNLEAI